MKKLTAILLALAFALGSLSLPAMAESSPMQSVPREIPAAGVTASGTLWDYESWTTVDWVLDDNDTLTITGKGVITDLTPWLPEAWLENKYYKFIKKVVISDGVKAIGGCAFYECDALTEVTIPDSVKTIRGYLYGGAFEGCTSLKSLTIPNSVTEIQSKAFLNCSALESVKLPDKITYIASNVFGGCNSLKSVNIPDNVIEIENYAFQKCSSLKSITIPERVTEIGESAFRSCSSLKTVYVKSPYIADTLTSYSSSGYLLDYAETVILPKGIQATDYIINNYPFTRTSTIDGEAVTCYRKSQTCTDHYYDSSCDEDCIICGEVRNVTHSFKSGWSKDDTQHWRECTVCGKKLEKAEHTFDDGKCSVCGYVLYTVGDANGDGGVNNIDASLILQYDAGVATLDDAALAAADTDGNSAVNNIDASRILQLDAGVISAF